MIPLYHFCGASRSPVFLLRFIVSLLCFIYYFSRRRHSATASFSNADADPVSGLGCCSNADTARRCGFTLATASFFDRGFERGIGSTCPSGRRISLIKYLRRLAVASYFNPSLSSTKRGSIGRGLGLLLHPFEHGPGLLLHPFRTRRIS